MSVQEPNQYDNVLLTKIKEDNTQLRLNFDKLKDTYEVLQDNYDSVAKKLKLMEEEKRKMEEHHNNVVSEWRQLLNDKAAEFDEMRQNLPLPVDYDQIRLQCFVEYRDEYQIKWDTLTEECANWRNLFNKVQRDHEEFKASLDNKEKTYQTFIEDLHSSHEEEKALLQLKIKEKNEALELQSALSARITELQRENGELELKNKSLTSEIVDNQKTNAELLQTKSAEIEGLKKQIANLKIAHDTSLAEKDSIKKSMTDLHESLRNEKKRHDELHQENAAMKAKLSEFQSRQSEMLHLHEVERSDQEFAFEKERTIWTQTRENLELKIVELQHKLAQRDSEIFTFDETLKQKDSEFSRRLKASEEQLLQKQRELEASITRLHQVVSDRENETERLKQEWQKDRASLIEDKQNIQASLNRSNTQLERYSADADKADAELHSLTKEVKELREKLEEYSTRENEMKMTQNERERHMNDVKRKLVLIEEENESLRRNFVAEREKHKNETQQLVQKVKDMQSMNKDYEAALAKEKKLFKDSTTEFAEKLKQNQVTAKKLKECYKKKLEQLKSAYDSLYEQLQQSESEKDDLRRELNQQSDAVKLRLKEEYSKQQQIVNLLKQEGVFKV